MKWNIYKIVHVSGTDSIEDSKMNITINNKEMAEAFVCKNENIYSRYIQLSLVTFSMLFT